MGEEAVTGKAATGAPVEENNTSPVDDRSLPTVPPEPEELKAARYQAQLSGADIPETWSGDLSVGTWLWPWWETELSGRGVTRDLFFSTLVAYHREEWLWLGGDRRWDQFATGLWGRLLRRAG